MFEIIWFSMLGIYVFCILYVTLSFVFNFGPFKSFNFIDYIKEEGRKRDKLRKKNKEVWHYTCINGHKWISLQSPRGTFVYKESGQTKCPECKSPICSGQVYINGKYTNMGACHEGMLK